MKNETLIRKHFNKMDVAWMPEKEREEYFLANVYPQLNQIIEESLDSGMSEAQVDRMLTLVFGAVEANAQYKR